jgi:hypothetical protein
VRKRALLFFFLSAGEKEREGEQVLLTWALGSSANRKVTKMALEAKQDICLA